MNDLQPADERLGMFNRGADIEGHDAPAALHHLQRSRSVSGGARQPWVAHRGDGRVLREVSGESVRIRGHFLGADFERLEPTFKQRRGIGVKRGTECLPAEPEAVVVVLGSCYRAGHEVIVSAEGLGRAVYHQIRSERERVLMVRRREGVVDDQLDGVLAGDGGEGCDVDDFAERVGRRFAEDHPGVGLDILFDALRLIRVEPGDLDAEPFQRE